MSIELLAKCQDVEITFFSFLPVASSISKLVTILIKFTNINITTFLVRRSDQISALISPICISNENKNR